MAARDEAEPPITEMTNEASRLQHESRTPNALIHEKSPYLLQHAYNPVAWRPWGPEAFDAARRESKPVFLSIGYSTCHWCHVMERESFEDEEVARAMNEAFVCIKVDREERPDIDNVYMRACQMLTGSGGWPLTIVMTPEKRPFFAGTYIPKGERFGQPGMLSLIPRISELWLQRRADVETSAEEIMAALQKTERPAGGETLGAETLSAAVEEMAGRYDEKNGGFGRAPKFPTPHSLIFLLRYAQRSQDAFPREMAEQTLSAMRRGGIYDHVGFGFHRYATDPEWLVPHFEKMIYDQALLVMAYVEAFEASRKPEYAKTAREILDYVMRRMQDGEGAFYSAEDADSEGEEGKFYLWRESEIGAALSPSEASLVAVAMNTLPEGNFVEPGSSQSDGENILHVREAPERIAARIGIGAEEFEQRWQAARAKLFLRREERVHPLRDDKILADWNGLMIAALGKAAQAFDEPRYAAEAQRAADFVLTRMKAPNGVLFHRYREGAAAMPAHLDDYAFMIWGLIELYQASFEVRNLRAALDLTDHAASLFWDGDHGGFYFTAGNQEEILLRAKESYDGAVPSGNAAMALNLLRLSHLTGRTDLGEKAAKAFDAFAATIRKSASAYTHWLAALDFALGPASEVVVCGDPASDDTRAMLRALRREYSPRSVVILRPPAADGAEVIELAPYTRDQSALGGKATAYVCRNFSCLRPTTDLAEMVANLRGFH